MNEECRTNIIDGISEVMKIVNQYSPNHLQLTEKGSLNRYKRTKKCREHVKTYIGPVKLIIQYSKKFVEDPFTTETTTKSSVTWINSNLTLKTKRKGHIQ